MAGLAMASTPARADTYLMVVNSLSEPISVNNNKVAPKEGSWTALDATIQIGNGAPIVVSDAHSKCADGGWRIQAAGPASSNYCIKLGVGEVGCIYAGVRRPSASAPPTIEMVKTSLGVCSASWYNGAGKKVIFELADQIAKTGVAIAEAVASVKGAKP